MAASFLPTVLDRFVHPRFLDEDTDHFHRARLAATFAWTLILLGCFYAVIFYWMHSPVCAIALLAGVVLATACLAVIRYGGSLCCGGHFLAAAQFCVVTVLGCRLGGHGAHALAWYVGVPVVALGMSGMRAGAIWLAVTAIALVAFYVVDRFGVVLPNDLNELDYELLGVLSWIGLIALVASLACLYQLFLTRTLREHKDMASALQISEERLKLAMSVTNDGMFDWDLETNKTFFDNRYYSMAGYDSNDFAGTYDDWAERVHPDDFGNAKACLDRFLGDQEAVCDVEFRFKRKDGAWMWIRGRAKIVERDGQGKPKRVVGTHTDITDRKCVELQLLRAKDKAEAGTRAKSEFLANMSHEIRTPMTAILGYAEILSAEVTNQEQRDIATTIRQNGDYLLKILNDILDLSKIEAGQFEIEHAQCSPFRILADVASLMRVPANAKGLALEVEYDGPMPETIRSDPTRLRQILINLVGNAVKFTESGRIRLVARLETTGQDEAKMQFEVIDSGIGISQEEIARLFRPFQQADTSTTRRFGGTGLGLTISKRLAQQLGGDIAVESSPGKGSTFRVTIATGPLDGVEMVDSPSEARLPDMRSRQAIDAQVPLGCRVLLAEDGPENQRLISLLLRKAGVDVTVADNGEVAHDLALAARREGAPFDVILMDMQMPVMDGYEATRRLRKTGYTGPIIAATAHAMSTDRTECLSAGCNAYLAKPIQRETLISLVAEHATTARRARESLEDNSV